MTTIVLLSWWLNRAQLMYIVHVTASTCIFWVPRLKNEFKGELTHFLGRTEISLEELCIWRGKLLTAIRLTRCYWSCKHFLWCVTCIPRDICRPCSFLASFTFRFIAVRKGHERMPNQSRSDRRAAPYCSQRGVSLQNSPRQNSHHFIYPIHTWRHELSDPSLKGRRLVRTTEINH